MQADLCSMPVTQESCRRSWKRLAGLQLKISTMRRKFWWMHKRLRFRRKRLCAVSRRALSLSVTVFGVTSKTVNSSWQSFKAQLQWEAARRFKSTGWSAPRKIPPSLCRPAWLLRCTVTCSVIIIINVIIELTASVPGQGITVSTASDICGICNNSYWKWLDFKIFQIF